MTIRQGQSNMLNMLRVLALAAFFLLLFVCTLQRAAAEGWKLGSSIPYDPAPAAGVQFISKTVQGSREVRIKLVMFDAKKYNLKIVDQPGEDRVALDAAMKAAGCVAGVNGGFFHPDFKPAGLVVTGGKVESPMQKAKLLSGVLATIKGKVQILRSGEFRLSPATSEAIQAGPFLVDAGKPVSGLNGKRIARRTIALTDGHDVAALAVIPDSVTLEEAAQILAAPGVISEFKLARALNLDGGKSTALWVATNPAFYIREFGAIRNFVGIVGVQ